MAVIISYAGCCPENGLGIWLAGGGALIPKNSGRAGERKGLVGGAPENEPDFVGWTRVTFIWREERGQLEGRDVQGPGTPAWLGGRLEVGRGSSWSGWWKAGG